MNPVRLDRGSQSEQYMKCLDACKPTHYKGLKCVERLLSKQQQQQIDMFNVGITKTEFRWNDINKQISDMGKVGITKTKFR
jgi:hypothetical protein